MDTRIVLAYNKKHNEDPSIAPWVLKHRGETYYVWKVNSKVGFDTKNNPDNPHTKGVIQMRGNLVIEREDGKDVAVVTPV